MLAKKSIVLTSASDGDEKAVLSIQCDNNMLTGKLRLYNFGVEPRGIISLGIFDKNRVIKAGLTKISSMLFSFQTQLEKIPDKFSCAVVNFVGGEPAPILYGNSEGICDKEDIFENVISALSGVKSVSETEKVLDKYGIDFDDDEKDIIDKTITQCINEKCDSCENCKYKQFYFSHYKAFQQEEQEEPVDNNLEDSKKTFFQEISSQVEKLFEKNPPEEYLQDLIPESKWVKVQFEDSGDYYVFGLVYQDEELKYVCYGVPGVYQKQAPRELSGYPVWFPLDDSKREGFGYWLTYQDAKSGESVKAIVE